MIARYCVEVIAGALILGALLAAIDASDERRELAWPGQCDHPFRANPFQCDGFAFNA